MSKTNNNASTSANASANTSASANNGSEMEIQNYVKSIAVEKKRLMDAMSKEELVNLVFKQNNLMSQQSSQMLEIVDMANSIETNARSDESKKCDIEKINHNILDLQKQQIGIYEKSFRTQLMLFILFIVILVWLLYHYLVSTKIE